jgi:hypothetical protein
LGPREIFHKGRPLYRLTIEDKYIPEGLGRYGGTHVANPANLPPDEEEKDEDKRTNKIAGTLRSCYVNEVKSAKELKISIKGGQHVYFFPNIQYVVNTGGISDHILDFRSRRPAVVGGLGMAPDPMNFLNAQTLYCNDMDRWILNNKTVFERWQI